MNQPATIRTALSETREELVCLIRARYPLVYVVSYEERRVEELLQEIAQRLSKRILVWTVTRGFVDPGSGGAEDNTADPLLALDKLLKTPADVGTLYVLKDFHPFLDSNQVV